MTAALKHGCTFSRSVYIETEETDWVNDVGRGNGIGNVIEIGTANRDGPRGRGPLHPTVGRDGEGWGGGAEKKCLTHTFIHMVIMINV